MMWQCNDVAVNRTIHHVIRWSNCWDHVASNQICVSQYQT